MVRDNRRMLDNTAGINAINPYYIALLNLGSLPNRFPW